MHFIQLADSTKPGPKAKSCPWDTLSPCTGTAGVGDSSVGMVPRVGAHPQRSQETQGDGYPLLLPLSTPGPCLYGASRGINRGGQVLQRPLPRQPGAGATAAVLNISEDQMRFLRTRKPPTIFPLSFLPLHFVTDKGEGKPSCAFQKLYIYTYICMSVYIYTSLYRF